MLTQQNGAGGGRRERVPPPAWSKAGALEVSAPETGVRILGSICVE